MFVNVFNRIKKINPALLIVFILFLIPFFWFKPREMDLGGDGTRLYFYDPQAFLSNAVLFIVEPHGKGYLESRQAYLIYVALLALIKLVVGSGHYLVNTFNGIKLSIGFLSIYLIVKEFVNTDDEDKKNLPIELSAIIAGLFYILSTGSHNYIFFWVKALHSHDQIFLNPLLFLLLLRYFLTRKRIYMLGAIFISFLFSTNFGTISAPPFFAFYPIAIIFLLLYVIFIKKRKIIIKDVIIGIVLFIGMHMFHFLPEIMILFDHGSVTHNIVFKGSRVEGINFFDALLPTGMVSMSLLLPAPTQMFRGLTFFAPLIIVYGYLFQKNKSKEILLTSVFFLITLFLISANITNVGVFMYRNLFYIPGFSMFRHFFIQWAYIFIFFYALLFGQSLFLVFTRIKKKYMFACAISIVFFSVLSFWQFLNGSLVDGINWTSNGVKTAIVIDPTYKTTLGFIKSLPDDGKMLVLPLSSNFNQVIYDSEHNSAYVGPSTISFLTQKKSFAGEQIFQPVSEDLKRLAQEKNYDALTQIFSLFNVRYVLYNSDPNVFEKKFPIFPYENIRPFFPKTQEEYKEFIKKFPMQLIYENGTYQIFEFDKKVYRPEIYIPDEINTGDMISAVSKHITSYQSAFLDKETCKKNQIVAQMCEIKYDPPKAEVMVKRINPTQYRVHISQSESKSPFLLVFQNSFHESWKISVDKDQPLSEKKHVLVNQYANAWIISNDDRKGKNDYTLYLNLEKQRYVWIGLWISGLSLLLFCAVTIGSVVTKNK